MKKTITTEIIEILWRGPFTLRELNDEVYNDTGYLQNLFNKSEFPHYGLYQIYGTHPVSGPNSLLYIGQTNYFSGRIYTHNEEWIKYEYDDVKVYIGIIGSEKDQKISKAEYMNMLNMAEKFLVYMCQPPYNSTSKAVFKHNAEEGTSLAIYNFGKKALMPTELSTYYHDSEIWENSEWKPVRHDD